MRCARPLLVVASLVALSTNALAGPHLEEVDDERPRASVARIPPSTTAPAAPTTPAAPITAVATATAAVEEQAVAPAKDDLARVDVQAEARRPSTRDKWISAGGTVAIYGALYGWLTAAWWVRTTDSGEFQTHDEGWFGANTYAGGADKLGHLAGNYAMTRGVAQILHHGGWKQQGSAGVAGVLSLGFFTFSEIKDGYKQEYGFSWGDMIANTTGAALGVLMELAPSVDRRVDIRVSYKPSQLYLDRLKSDGPFNTPEDYTGQTFLVAYHLGSIELVKRHANWARFFDVNLGYQAVNYKPVPVDGAVASQELFIGGSINLQAVTESLMGNRAGAGAMNFVTEIFQPPYTTLRAGQLDRTGVPEPEGPSSSLVTD